jgi:hypothetical protein
MDPDSDPDPEHWWKESLQNHLLLNFFIICFFYICSEEGWRRRAGGGRPKSGARGTRRGGQASGQEASQDTPVRGRLGLLRSAFTMSVSVPNLSVQASFGVRENSNCKKKTILYWVSPLIKVTDPPPPNFYKFKAHFSPLDPYLLAIHYGYKHRYQGIIPYQYLPL